MPETVFLMDCRSTKKTLDLGSFAYNFFVIWVLFNTINRTGRSRQKEIGVRKKERGSKTGSIRTDPENSRKVEHTAEDLIRSFCYAGIWLAGKENTRKERKSGRSG